MPLVEVDIEGFRRRGLGVRTVDLVKIYKLGKVEVQALRGLTMSVSPGEVVSIMGPSGSGKTTLLNVIGGVDRPSAGRVYVGDVDISYFSERELERHRLVNVGYVFQAFNLIPVLTALENVELPMMIAGVPRGVRRRRARWLLEKVGLKGKEGHHPDELSGGEQQRVAIAVALANDPPVILADEPTGELDSANAAMVTRLLVGLAKEARKTVIIATHDPRVAMKADRILRIEDGRIVGEYSPVDLEAEAPGQAKPVGLAELIRIRLASMEREVEELEERLRAGAISVEEFHRKYSRIKRLEEALKELLASIGEG